MANHGITWAVVCTALSLSNVAKGAVEVVVPPTKVTKEAGGEGLVQKVTLANELTQYTLTYDILRPPDKPVGEVTSHWWVWTTGYVTLSMTESGANWYWQGFFNWHFDEESLYNREAKVRVVHDSGEDGMVEYLWDTPKVTASLRLALATDSDKLLMFARYTPKTEIKQSYFRAVCYPATFAQPWNRTVTTPAGTTQAGATLKLDLSRDRWVLYEDTTEGRPAEGSAGLLMGTPEAFTAVTIPVETYGITTRLDLKPETRSFALAFYQCPSLPDYRQTRAYFQESATREAALLQKMAGGNLDEPLPPLPVSDSRRTALLKASGDLTLRPSERWNPAPVTVSFPWARKLGGGPLRTVVFAPRWCAYETMLLARQLDMAAEHLYFDGRNVLVAPECWPYSGTTGIGPVGRGQAALHAATICADSKAEVFLVAAVSGEAIPLTAKRKLLGKVREGRGLLLVGTPSLDGWPKDLFSVPEPGLVESVLSNFAWEQVPGYRKGDRGRVVEGTPLEAYRYGKGIAFAFRIGLGDYNSLVPPNNASEGLEGATDRCLALCAKAALAASGRPSSARLSLGSMDMQSHSIPVTITPAPPGKGQLVARIQDDLDRELSLQSANLPLPGGRLPLPGLSTGGKCFLDVALCDERGNCMDLASALLPEAPGPALQEVSVSPAVLVHEAAPPMVDLPRGGKLECSAVVKAETALHGAQLAWEVRDIFDRLLAQAETPVPAAGGKVATTVVLPRPVTVCHQLDVALQAGGQTLAFARKRFTARMSYPYDDFTVLMWSYAGGERVLQRTNRLCYEMGADMMDLCHMGGYSHEGAAREYSLSARSGLRLLPYVTWIGGKADTNHYRVPCLHDPAYLGQTCKALATTCRQAAPYSPVAFTLGDENVLFDGGGECCHRPESVKAFQQWLEQKYTTIATLNQAWGTNYPSFAAIETPMLLEEAAKQQVSFAPWIEHKLFMDTAFAQTHEKFAEIIREQVPGAKVGWDGFCSSGWQAGYDFTKLTKNLELNQTYVSLWLHGEFVRSFKRRDALTGKWGNAIADNEAGWSAFPWDCLLAGDNSVWWWTSWGCDYIPFNPDLSLSNFGKWFFASAREATSGPGKLLLHAKRDNSGIGVLYSQTDMFGAALLGQIVAGTEFSDTSSFWRQHEALLKGLKDLGYQYQHVSHEDLELGKLSPSDYRVLFISLATCLSNNQVATLRRFVEAGGTLVVDGRAGLLTGNGRIRDSRPLDELSGVRSEAGLAALRRPPANGELSMTGQLSGTTTEVPVALDKLPIRILEPGMKTTTGKALAEVGGAPVLVSNVVGKGRAVTLNLGLGSILDTRAAERPSPLFEVLSAILRSAGVSPPCDLTRTDGSPPRCVQQVLFTDGSLRYLALQQDLLLPQLSDQQAHVKLPKPAVVYDLRAGKRVGQGLVAEWDVTLSRGRPLVYSLLPYEVRSVTVQSPRTAATGTTVKVGVNVSVSTGKAETHVARLHAYAPGAGAPHRQYSQNVSCPNGKGNADIPFALNDKVGVWKLEARDVASGMTTTKTLVLK